MTKKKEPSPDTIVGVCRFCKQQRIIEYFTEDPDEEATILCNCTDGEGYREREKVLQTAADNIEATFGDKMPDVAEIFQELKGRVYDGHIGSVTLKLPGGTTAKLWRPAFTTIKIQYKKQSVTELSTAD